MRLNIYLENIALMYNREQALGILLYIRILDDDDDCFDIRWRRTTIRTKSARASLLRCIYNNVTAWVRDCASYIKMYILRSSTLIKLLCTSSSSSYMCCGSLELGFWRAESMHIIRYWKCKNGQVLMMRA